MAYWLRILVLAEDLALIPSTYMMEQMAGNSVPGDPLTAFGFHGHQAFIWCIDMHVTIDIHKIKLIFLFIFTSLRRGLSGYPWLS